MKIEVLQSKSEGSNEFDIKYDGVLKYRANLPFVSINDPFNLEKLRKIKILDLNGNEIYSTDYKYLENLKEELIPFKYLVTGSQQFNQLLFNSNENSIKIYYEANGVLSSRYVIEIDDKKYYCYSIEDGYIRHFPIYDGNNQIGEILKSNVITDGKDEYWCYLKDEYKSLSDGVISLLLYLDRSEYNSSYVVNRSYSLNKNYTFDRTNKFYDKKWVIKNFGDEFFKKVDNEVKFTKQKFKNFLITLKEQLISSISRKKR